MKANAGNIGHRLPIASHIRETAKGHINILMVSYRGYGLSGGSPTENGIRLDAQAALEYLLSRDGEGKVNPTKIVVYGQSIGGAVAIYLASTSPDKIAGLIVENTFISLPVLIRHVFPALAWAAPLLLHQLWESNLRLEELSAKIRDMHQIKVDATKEDEIKIKETKKNNEISIDKIDKDSDIGNVHQRRTKVAHEDKVSDDGSGAIKALFLSGSRDELIPVYHMQTLYTILKRALPTAKFVSFPDGTHNDTFLKTGYFDAINTFLSEL